MIKINENNQIVIQRECGEESIYDFNSYYKGYYPFCRFTAVNERNNHFYAAGMDEAGCPHLFSSAGGIVWDERVIEPRFRLTAVREYGKIQDILPDPHSELLFLVTENGYLVILPDCRKCVRALYLSDLPVVGGWIKGERICLRDIRGNVKECLKNTASWHRCSLSYAMPHLGKDGILLDLREYDERQEFSIAGSVPIEETDLEHLLERLSAELYLFFVCGQGARADAAAALARELGHEHAFSLGGMGDILPDMEDV